MPLSESIQEVRTFCECPFMTPEKLREWISPDLPDGAAFGIQPGEGDSVIRINWLLGNDPECPDKRSKTIRLVVAEEAVEEYELAPEAGKETAKTRLVGYFRARLAEFDPDHDSPRHTQPPEESWIVTSLMLGFG